MTSRSERIIFSIQDVQQDKILYFDLDTDVVNELNLDHLKSAI